MKKLMLLLTGMVGFTLHSVAADMPRGSLLELHSCELFAGGCTVSGESPQDGRYMLRCWDFTGGNFNGTELKGLKIAVLQASGDNLASANSKSGNAVVYLPQNATDAQRDSLLAWVKASQPDFKPAKIETRTVPMQFAKTEKGYAFTAGDFISVKTLTEDSCETSCGEELWYQPRATTSLFTVVVNTASKINEPLLKLKWTDAAKRSVFLARFGESGSSKDVFVTLGELCGTTKSLF
jgi:hypothetical protein